MVTHRERIRSIPSLTRRDCQLTAHWERCYLSPRLVHDNSLPGHSNFQHDHHCILHNVAPTIVLKASSSPIDLQKVDQKVREERS